MSFLEQVKEMIQANGWENLLVVEQVADQDIHLQIKLGPQHPLAPSEVVNDYFASRHPVEQIQQECLRAIRTGRPGV